MICYACKGKVFKREVLELVIRVGEHRTVDRSVTRPVCQTCREFVVPSAIYEQVELRAALVAFTEAPTVTGAMLHFGRKALGLTQADLAERIGTTFESISRWEREERPMEPWVPLTVLALLRERLMPPPKNVEFKRAG
jgi:DNA-binding transcriptional regulator YiaG